MVDCCYTLLCIEGLVVIARALDGAPARPEEPRGRYGRQYPEDQFSGVLGNQGTPGPHRVK